MAQSEIVHRPDCNAWCSAYGHWLLPTGPVGEPLPWDELKPYERDQGGYWLYGPWCDVYGNGKIWVPVKP